MIDFYKYHGLGNDYIVIDAANACFTVTPSIVSLICDRHYGIGSDGILLGNLADALTPAIADLRIYNPDGSEAEKSGNGLRIFAWFLYEYGYTSNLEFSICVDGGIIPVQIVDPSNKTVSINMGVPSFNALTAAPMLGLDEIADYEYDFGLGLCRMSFVSVGNPHCVIYGQPLSKALTCKLGPLIERSHIFPARVNVQFLEVISPHEIRIEVWERGAGYTLASGSSSCAAAVVANRMGLVGKNVTVKMPGGMLQVVLTKDAIQLSGPVEKTFEGKFSTDLMTKIKSCNA